MLATALRTAAAAAKVAADEYEAEAIPFAARLVERDAARSKAKAAEKAAREAFRAAATALYRHNLAAGGLAAELSRKGDHAGAAAAQASVIPVPRVDVAIAEGYELEITDSSLIPFAFLEPDTAAIREALARGKRIPGARLVTVWRARL